MKKATSPWPRLAIFVGIGLTTLSLAMSENPPAPSTPTDAKGAAEPSSSPGGPNADPNKVEKAEDLEQSLKDLLDGVKPDKEEPPAPKPPPSAKPAEPPPASPAPAAALPPAAVFAHAVQSADAEKLNQIGKVIAAKLQHEENEAVRRVLIEAGTKVVQQQDRLAAEPQPPARQRLHVDIEKLAYRQAVAIANGTKTVGTSGDVSSGHEISRAAWEGRQSQPSGVVVAPRGTAYFSGTFARMNDPTPYHPAPRDNPAPPAAAQPASTVPKKHEPPPPPPPSAASSAGRPAEKGVRMQFDPVALELASSRVPILSEVEDRLLEARGPEQVGRALAWVDERVNDALQVGKATSSLERVTVVSVRQLCRAAKAYRERWPQLPEELRHPGPLRRIHGFLIDADGQDVLLLGSGDGSGEPLDIDDLSQAFRAVWRDGLTPICSLDPEPWNMGGPQRAVIAGVSRSSHFARVMLDADYQLKKVLFGEERPKIEAFQDLKQVMQSWNEKTDGAERPAVKFNGRFWFTSVPPGAGEIRLSPDGRLALFDARVQVLTEDMLNQGGKLVNAGTRHPLVVSVTQGFTRDFAAFQTQMPVFRQLQSLFDVTLAATLLKRQGAPAALLEELAALPVRPADVPDTYAGLTVVGGKRGLHVTYLQGGVQMSTSLGSRALIRVNDPRGQRFRERAAAGNGVAREIDDAGLAIVACAGTSNDSPDGPPADGEASATVLAALDELIESDPANSEYRKRRSRAYFRMGLHYLAEQELRAAALCQPDDPVLPLLRLRLRLERGEITDPAALPPGQADILADLYLIESVRRHGAGADDAALEAVDWALKLRPSRTDLVFHRVNVLLTSRPAEAVAFLTDSIRQSPKDERLYLARAQAQFRSQAWTEAIADATRAIELEPRFVHAFLVRAVALLSGNPPDTRRAYADLRRIQELDANHPGALVVRANLLRIEGDRDGAVAAINRAVQLAPMMAEARMVRVLIYADSVLPDDNPTSPRALEDPAAALQMLQDLNVVLLSQPSQWQMRVVRSQLLLAYYSRLSDAALDWKTILPQLAAVIDQTPHGRQRFAAAQEPTTPEEAVEFREMFTAALLDAIVDELASARSSAPEAVRPKLLEQENFLRSRLANIPEERKP